MEFGVWIPDHEPGNPYSRQTLVDAAQKAEAMGYDSLWLGDHIVVPWSFDSRYPYNDDGAFPVTPRDNVLEPLTVLAYLAAHTQRIKLGVGVMVLPYRHPVYAAKVATTLDYLSQGRFILGVGAGWLEGEFEALGASFPDRGDVSDEQLAIIQELWGKEKPRFEGRFYKFDETGFYPKPVQKPRIPIWVGGNKGRARSRAAIYGDAWYPAIMPLVDPPKLASMFDDVREKAKKAGRDPDEINLTAFLSVDLQNPPTAPEGEAITGSVEQVVEALKSYEAIGMKYAVAEVFGDPLPDRFKQWEEFARTVIPKLRS